MSIVFYKFSLCLKAILEDFPASSCRPDSSSGKEMEKWIELREQPESSLSPYLHHQTRQVGWIVESFVGCGHGLTCWSQSLGTETCLTEWGGMSATSVVALLAGS